MAALGARVKFVFSALPENLWVDSTGKMAEELFSRVLGLILVLVQSEMEDDKPCFLRETAGKYGFLFSVTEPVKSPDNAVLHGKMVNREEEPVLVRSVFTAEVLPSNSR